MAEVRLTDIRKSFGALEIIKGVNVTYINDFQIETENAVGDTPMKVAATEEAFNEIKLHKAPGIYEIGTRTKPGKDGKATVVLTKAKFVEAFSLAQYE